MSTSTLVFDQSDWRHIAVRGADRVRFLNGMVTGDIAAMGEGSWLRTLLLNHKARVLSVFEVHAMQDHLLLSCSPGLYERTFEVLDRHIVMDDVDLQERKCPMHSRWENSEDVWTCAPLLTACEPGQGSGEDALECRRIEAGMPTVGAFVSDENFPFESLLVRLINYEKGCFTGQEPVARVRARGGGGSKRICGLRSDDNALLPVGAALATPKKPEAGRVCSAAFSEQFGSIALAYVHKSAWEPGSIVTIGDRSLSVCSLPFGSD